MKIIALLLLNFSLLVQVSSAQILRPGAGAGAVSSKQNAQQNLLRQVGIDQKLNNQIPLDLIFRDETGRLLPLREYFGSRPAVLALVYYRCPMLCTITMDGLLKTLQEIPLNVGKEFDVIAVSFDPRETAELAAAKKAHYLERYHRDGTASGFHFLTGDENSIKRLTDAVGFRYVYDEKNDQFAHASGLMVLTPLGKVARYLYGVEFAPRNLQFSLMEASQNRIGSPVDRVLLYCYHYDPANGKYTPITINLVRMGGLLTVLALTILLIAMFRWERKSKAEGVSRNQF
jgi:protein SCO1/2